MEELTKLLTKIELAADEVIDTRQQIINLDAKGHKVREACNRFRELQQQKRSYSEPKYWVCLGDMFIRLNTNDTRNLLTDERYHIDQGVENLRDQLKEKVNKLQELEGKPELTGFNLKPLKKEEILALRTAFKL